MQLKDSRTKQNLMRAFVEEGEARNRYNIAALIAKQEKLKIIQDLFEYTANQERAHAQVYYNDLKEFSGENNIIDQVVCPINAFTTTLQLLKQSVKDEFAEHDKIYKEFADIAMEEGFIKIADTFNMIRSVEKCHGERFQRYAEELESGSLFKKNQEEKWMCTHCGYIHHGTEAPQKCPVCSHTQDYYILYERSNFQ